MWKIKKKTRAGGGRDYNWWNPSSSTPPICRFLTLIGTHYYHYYYYVLEKCKNLKMKKFTIPKVFMLDNGSSSVG